MRDLRQIPTSIRHQVSGERAASVVPTGLWSFGAFNQTPLVTFFLESFMRQTADRAPVSFDASTPRAANSTIITGAV